jgi:hypothetical protein
MSALSVRWCAISHTVWVCVCPQMACAAAHHGEDASQRIRLTRRLKKQSMAAVARALQADWVGEMAHIKETELPKYVAANGLPRRVLSLADMVAPLVLRDLAFVEVEGLCCEMRRCLHALVMLENKPLRRYYNPRHKPPPDSLREEVCLIQERSDGCLEVSWMSVADLLQG